jgi:hypothetical protein
MRAPTSLRTALLVAALTYPLVTPAEIKIAVGAQADHAVNDEVAFDASVTRAWGRAGDTFINNPYLHIQEGLPGCLVVDCGPFNTVPGVSGTARADATKMNVGVRAYGAGATNTSGFGEVEVHDQLNIPAGSSSLPFEVHLDLELSASLNANSTFTFGIALGSGEDKRTAFSFTATDDGTSRTVRAFLDNGATELVLDHIPSSFDHAFAVPVIAAFPSSLAIEIFARGAVDSGSGASAFVDGFNSAWLGIGGSFTSANGYSYPGFTAPIPEPTTAALFLAGLAVVTLGYRRSRAALR